MINIDQAILMELLHCRYFFSIIKRTQLFGEKDFQQIKIIQELVKIKNHNIKIVHALH